MVKHRIICDYIRLLNQCNASVKRTLKLNRVFREKKCRLRLENLTRWSSGYLMLESVKRALNKNAFEKSDTECPVEADVIDTYLQLLQQSYIVNLGFQSNHTSIADVLSTIKLLKDYYTRVKLDEIPKSLALWIVKFLNKKFEFELNSDIYKVNYNIPI